MCGLAGVLRMPTQDSAELERVARCMTDCLRHRGPDDSGVWSQADCGLAFGHRRLSILDLSPQGHQPMVSRCGRYCLVYNGEIYNFRELRGQLISAGSCFRGTSDTEVLLEGVARWGIETTLTRAVGMFAMVVWDRQRRILTLVRDRLGIKPLYYGWWKGTFLFASELKGLRAYPEFAPSIDPEALAQFLHHGYIPAPDSIYQGIRKLLPGTLLEVGCDSLPESCQPTSWWCLNDVVQRGRSEPFVGDEEAAVDQLDHVLREAVAVRMLADVPLGAFLSGGFDSSTVVALMQAQSSCAIKTFSMGFEESDYDEAPHARAIAEHLGTDHTQCYVTSQQARDVIPMLPDMYDEPFGDSSQIPTYLVSQIARRDVTVALSGDGGDELFCGYQRYFTMRRLWHQTAWIPAFVRRRLAGSLATFRTPRIPARVRRKLRTASEMLSVEGLDAFYWRYHSHWRDNPCLQAANIVQVLCDRYGEDCQQAGSFWERLMYLDCLTYLPEDILTKVDRASMAVSLEARVPILDHRVVEFAWRLPLAWKVRGGESKWLLRRVLERYVPRELTNRPKMGFGVPLGSWLRGPLRDWAEDLLSPDRLRQDGYLQVEPIRQKWEEHLHGVNSWEYLLWDVLMFQAWLMKQ